MATKQTLTDEEKAEIIGKWMLYAALGSGALGLGTQLYGNLTRDYMEPDPEETKGTDVEIPSTSSLFSKESSMEKPAGLERWQATGLLPTMLAGFGGYGLGNWAADKVTNRLLRDKLEEQKKRFKRNMLRERMLASKLQEKGIFLPYTKSSSIEKEAQGDGPGIIGSIGNFYLAWALLSGTLGYFGTKEYLKNVDPEYTEYNQAKEHLRKRLMSGPPTATLGESIDMDKKNEKMIKDVQNWARNKGLIPEESKI